MTDRLVEGVVVIRRLSPIFPGNWKNSDKTPGKPEGSGVTGCKTEKPVYCHLGSGTYKTTRDGFRRLGAK